MAEYTPAAHRAAQGKVNNQDNKIVAIILVLARLVVSPMPKSAPTDTWVVDTGKPSLLAKITKNAVVKLADKPWP